MVSLARLAIAVLVIELHVDADVVRLTQVVRKICAARFVSFGAPWASGELVVGSLSIASIPVVIADSIAKCLRKVTACFVAVATERLLLARAPH